LDEFGIESEVIGKTEYHWQHFIIVPWQNVTDRVSGVRRKFSWGGVHSLANGGGYLYLVCAVCDVTIWRHIHVSKPTFWRSLSTQYAYFSTCALLFCVIAL